MSPPQHRKTPGRRGAAAVELAILLPILGCLFVAALDFSRVFYFDIILMNCARNAAVYGSQDPTSAQDTAGIKTAAQRDASNLDVTKLNVSSSVNSTSNPTTVTVTVTYPFTTLTRYPGVPSSITLTHTMQISVVP